MADNPFMKYKAPATAPENPFLKYKKPDEAAPAPERSFASLPQSPQEALDLGSSYVQGRTMGWGPKIAAGMGSAIAKPVLEGVEALGGKEAPSISDLYTKGVDMYSAGFERARENTPGLAMAAELAGGLKTGKGAAASKAGKAIGGVVKKNLATKIIGGAAGGEASYRAYKTGEAKPGKEIEALTSGPPVGAILGVAAPAVGGAVGRVISPRTSKGVKKLMDEGVRMTPGELVSGPGKFVGNTLKAAEDKMTSVPLLGDAIIAGKRRSVNTLNEAALNRALSPIGKKLPDGLVGEDARLHVEKELGKAYDQTLQNMTANVDQKFSTDFAGVLQKAGKQLLGSEKKRFSTFIREDINPRFGGQKQLDGAQLKELQTKINTEISDYSGSADPNHIRMKRTLESLKQAVDDMVVRTNPKAAAALKQVDKGWANYAKIRKAASSTGKTAEGSVTPAQLDSAVKAQDASVGKGRFGTGTAQMQDLSTPGKRVLSSTVGDSGTAPRNAMVNALGWLGAGGAAVYNPAIPIGGAAAASMYSNPGQRVMETLLARRPQNARQLADFLVKKSSSPIFAGSLADQLVND